MADSEGFSNIIPQTVSLLSQYAYALFCSDLIQSFLIFHFWKFCWFHSSWLFRNRGKARFRFLLRPGSQGGVSSTTVIC